MIHTDQKRETMRYLYITMEIDLARCREIHKIHALSVDHRHFRFLGTRRDYESMVFHGKTQHFKEARVTGMLKP